jgi:hypothetical protein
VLARLAAEKQEREERRDESRRLYNERRREELAARNIRAVADFSSFLYTEREVAERYELSVDYLRRLARKAA